MDERERRIAENETRFREVNERLESAQASLGTGNGGIEVLCECGDRDCTDRITLNLADYEHVREDPTAFLVKPGHVKSGPEHALEDRADFTVVRKDGEAGEIAKQHDPRS
jgi:hypothetical protein